MKIRNFYFFFIIVIAAFVLFSCESSLSPSNSKKELILSNDTNMVITNDYLVYFQQNGKNYDCMKKVLPNGEESLIARFTIKPLDVVWDQKKEEVYFVTQEGVFKKNYFNSSSLERISDPLPQKENEIFGEAWIDKKSGNIQISYSISSYESNSKFEKRFKKLSSDTTVFLPDWGLDMIACIAELKTSGKWKLIKEKASRGEACDTPGLDVLRTDIKRKENTTSNQYEQLKSSYYGRVILDNNKGDKELDSLQVKKIFKNNIPFTLIDEEDVFEIHQLLISNDQSLLIPIYWGGNPYFSTPIFVYNQQTKVKKELKEVNKFVNKDSHSCIGVSIVDDYLLITNLYEDKNPLIYNLQTFDLVGNYPQVEEVFILVAKK